MISMTEDSVNRELKSAKLQEQKKKLLRKGRN